MSSSNGKWELGVAHVAERFDSFDRWTKFGEDFTEVTTAVSQVTMTHSLWDEYETTSSTVELDLDNDICSDYAESPFFLSGTIKDVDNTEVYGNEIVLGPSSDSDYDGAVERATIKSIKNDDDSLDARLELEKKGTHTHIAWPTAAYATGNPVLIRTMPHGWGTYSDFSSLKIIVRPALRYNQRDSIAELTGNAGVAGFPDVTNRERRSGVELCVNNSELKYGTWESAIENSNRYIQFTSDVNTFLPHIRKWRISWDYRLGKAEYASSQLAAQCKVRIIAALANADGSFLFPIKDGSGNSEGGPASDLDGDGFNDINRELKEYSAADLNSDWTWDSTYATYVYSESPEFDLGASTDNPIYRAFNRGNRWIIRAVLDAGINTAFGLDNVVIEHAHGTSDEANGYYEIDDWPDQSTIAFHEISRERGSKRLENGSLKVGYRDTPPKWGLSADFVNVDATIYRDMLVLLDWQKAGYPLTLRPHNTPLPTPLIGKMTIDKWRPQHWDIENRVSFTLAFEEI